MTKACWAKRKLHNINNKLVTLIEELYNKAMNNILIQCELGEWLHMMIGIRKSYPLSTTFFQHILMGNYEQWLRTSHLYGQYC